MARIIPLRLLVAALLVPAAVGTAHLAVQPASAQSAVDARSDVSFDAFYRRLQPYGRWFESDRWGYVWHPEAVGPDFRPYYDGHWVNTARYGWFWVSDEEWGDVVYHYGRWVFDPDDGWLWVPGYVWAPAWVIWREGDGATGWFPMPPDQDFYAGDESWRDDWSDAADDDYGYRDWYGPAFGTTFFSLWTFVDDDHFGDRHFHRYVHRDHDDRDLYRRTRDATHYTTVDNYVVNRGIDPDALRRRTGQAFVPVPLRDAAPGGTSRPTAIDLGRQIRRHEGRERPQSQPRWFRPGAPQTIFRAPVQSAPLNPQPREGVRVFRGAPSAPAVDGATVPAWQRQMQAPLPNRSAPVAAPPRGGQFGPRNYPQPPAVIQPQAPAAVAPAAPVAAPPNRFEPRRGDAQDMPPADVPVRRFERVQPPASPQVAAPPPPPPPPPVVLPAGNPPPAAPPRAEEANPRAHRRDTPQF